MSRRPAANRQQQIPKADSQEECARRAGYRLVLQNERAPEIVRSQARSIRTRYVIRNGLRPQCGCSLVNGRKCDTDVCPNKRYLCSCPPSCGAGCQNNPWANNGFIAGRKTFLKETEYGWGLFVTEHIPAGTWVGEYTGIVVRYREENYTSLQHSYLFRTQPEGLMIEAYEQGSAVRCVNHSCDPNCEACGYVDNEEYKVVYYTIKDVLAGVELTTNYAWEWLSREDAPTCKCGSPNCTGIIGFVIKPKPSRPRKGQKKRAKQIKQAKDAKNIHDPDNDDDAVVDPPPRAHTFQSITENAPAEVIQVLSIPPNPQERPPIYRETHEFLPAEPAYAIMQYNGRVGIVHGRITECYVNNQGITIYVLDVRTPTTMDYHLPRHLLFHYHEDAAYVLQHHIPDIERDQILQYSTPYASREVAEGLEFEIAETYAELHRQDQLSDTRLEHRQFPGSVSIGLAPSILSAIEADDNDEEDDNSSVSCSTQKTTNTTTASMNPTTITKQPSPVKTFTQVEIGIERTLESYALKQSTRDDGCTKRPATAQIVQQSQQYNPNFRRDIQQTRNDVHNLAMLKRVVETTSENVTIYTVSRIPLQVQVDHTHSYRQVLQVVQFHYIDAPHTQRRFLTFSHFNMVNEINQAGSTARFYCSFCGKKFTLDTFDRHFRLYHAMVDEYDCEKCRRKFSLPSVFREHLMDCDRIVGGSLLANINLQMMDAFADFLASRSANQNQMFVIRPGLPKVTKAPGNLKIQAKCENVMNEWPVHQHMGTLSQQDEQQSENDNECDLASSEAQPGPSTSRPPTSSRSKPKSKKRSRDDRRQERHARRQDEDEEEDDEEPVPQRTTRAARARAEGRAPPQRRIEAQPEVDCLFSSSESGDNLEVSEYQPPHRKRSK